MAGLTLTVIQAGSSPSNNLALDSAMQTVAILDIPPSQALLQSLVTALNQSGLAGFRPLLSQPGIPDLASLGGGNPQWPDEQRSRTNQAGAGNKEIEEEADEERVSGDDEVWVPLEPGRTRPARGDGRPPVPDPTDTLLVDELISDCLLAADRGPPVSIPTPQSAGDTFWAGKVEPLTSASGPALDMGSEHRSLVQGLMADDR